MSNASLGDAFHAITLLSTLTFAVAVVQFAGSSESIFFDEQWKRDGFCLARSEIPFWNSHDVSFYVDFILAFLHGLLYLLIRNTKGLEYANEYVVPNILGILGHGIGHETIAANIRRTMLEDTKSSDKFVHRLPELTSETVKELFLFAVFWSALLYASMPQTKRSFIAFFAVMATLAQTAVPTHLGFTYVQTVLFLAFSLNQTMLPEKDKKFGYALYPMLVSLPTTLVGWMESTQCTAFVKEKLYGHVVYDGYIAVSLILWYVICYIKAIEDNSMKEKIN